MEIDKRHKYKHQCILINGPIFDSQRVCCELFATYKVFDFETYFY